MNARRREAHGAEHLVGDVQRFGLLSAATIVDRYIGIVDRATAHNGLRAGAAAPPEVGPHWLTDTAATMAKAYLTLIDTTASLVEDRSARKTDGHRIEKLLLPPTAAGSVAESRLWIHNPTAAPAEVELHTTGLVSPSGTCIPLDAVTVLPQPVARVAPGTCQQVELRIQVPSKQPVGRYHGLVLSSVGSSEPVAVHLEVLPPGVGER